MAVHYAWGAEIVFLANKPRKEIFVVYDTQNKCRVCECRVQECAKDITEALNMMCKESI